MIITDMQPLILSNTSLFKEKLKDFVKILKKIFFVIATFLGDKLTRVKNFLAEKIKRYYYKIYPKISAFKKRSKKILVRLNIVIIGGLLIFTIVDIILKRTADNSILSGLPEQAIFIELVSIAIEVTLYFLLSLVLSIYHKNYGAEALNEIEREYTKEFVINYLPTIAKAWGYTGQGKDELIAGISTMKVENFKETIDSKLEEIQNICYFYDFKKVENAYFNNFALFTTSNEKISKKNFLNLCYANKFFFKPIYQKKINLEEFLESSKILAKNKLYTSPYIYDKGGINKKHYLELLYDYIMLKVRLHEDHFIFSNQPFIENMSSGKGAAKFSLNYLITKTQKPLRFKNEDYVEKVMFPFKNYLGIIETEAATWYSNIDKKNRAILQSLGLRDTKAFNRHIFDNFFWYQVDQDPSRVDKLFRELDHAYFYPDTRTVYEGAYGINAPLESEIEKLNKKIMKIENKAIKNLLKNEKLEERRQKNLRYYIASSNQKYKDSADMFRDSKKKLNFEKRVSKYKIRKKELMERVVLNKYHHTYITKIVTIGTEPQKNGNKPVLRPLDIINNPDLIKSSYSVKMTFKADDCWRYNTHYMASVKEARASKTELSLKDVPEWDLSLNLKKEDVVTFGYSQAAELFDINPDEIVMARYKKKN